MSEHIVLINALRLIADQKGRDGLGKLYFDAADALEAMAGEVAAITQLCADEQKKRVELIRERDRLKAALDWALGEGDEWPERKPGEGAFYWRAELRRKALGGDE